ncbi:MAG: methyltransferase domain-containing protein [Calothrix sp. MO_192.B10]|nr:methyltransferase domain-containing protein [Calothrix sp. MO_192.B10]
MEAIEDEAQSNFEFIVGESMLSIGKLSMQRPISDYAKIQKLWGNLIRGHKIQLLNKALRNKKYLNVGCGSNIDKRFINLDFNWRPGIDLCWDITSGMPIQDNSLTGIYTEHCLEHISYLDCLKTLSNFFKLLKSQGTLRIVVPDAELYLNLYVKGKDNKNLRFPYGQPAYELSDTQETPMMVVNSIFRGHGHEFVYDYHTLHQMLAKQGFVNIKKESFRCGRDTNLLVDSQLRACESLYVEASVP